MMLLDLPASTAEATFARLDQFHFAEDVTLEALQLAHLAMAARPSRGDRARDGHSRGLRGSGPGRSISTNRCIFRNRSSWSGSTSWKYPAIAYFLTPAAQGALSTTLAAAEGWRGVAGGHERCPDRGAIPDFRRRHERRHHPAGGRHRGPGHFHLEGCYVGQEVILRILHPCGRSGQAPGRPGHRWAGSVPGRPVSSGDREVGRVTSSTDRRRVQGPWPWPTCTGTSRPLGPNWPLPSRSAGRVRA